MSILFYLHHYKILLFPSITQTTRSTTVTVLLIYVNFRLQPWCHGGDLCKLYAGLVTYPCSCYMCNCACIVCRLLLFIVHVQVRHYISRDPMCSHRGHLALLSPSRTPRPPNLQAHPQGAPLLPGSLRHGGRVRTPR